MSCVPRLLSCVLYKERQYLEKVAVCAVPFRTLVLDENKQDGVALTSTSADLLGVNRWVFCPRTISADIAGARSHTLIIR